MKSDGNSESVNCVEEHTMKELKTKKEIATVWFEQSGENKDDKKTNWDSDINKNIEVKRNRHTHGKEICSSHEESNRSDESSDDLVEGFKNETEKDKIIKVGNLI